MPCNIGVTKKYRTAGEKRAITNNTIRTDELLPEMFVWYKLKLHL